MPVTSPAHRYLLIEVADECRHSQMFGEYIRRAGTPTYAPPVDTGMLDALADSSGQSALSYLLILAGEELLDATNRATMKDDRTHPVSRQIAKLHVTEEARPQLTADERDSVRAIASIAVSVVADLTVDPAVYEALGIEGGEALARANPHHQQRIIDGLAKLTAFLDDIGVIDDATRPAWRSSGLVS